VRTQIHLLTLHTSSYYYTVITAAALLRCVVSDILNIIVVVLLDCVTSDIVFVIRVIIALCFFVIFVSLNACIMDMFGPTHVVCRAIRFTASLSILSGMLLCACQLFVRLFVRLM